MEGLQWRWSPGRGFEQRQYDHDPLLALGTSMRVVAEDLLHDVDPGLARRFLGIIVAIILFGTEQRAGELEPTVDVGW